MADLMARLARDAGTNTACPMNTGIFLRIAGAELDRADVRRRPPTGVCSRTRAGSTPSTQEVSSPGEAPEAEGHILARNAHGAPARVEAISSRRGLGQTHHPTQGTHDSQF